MSKRKIDDFINVINAIGQPAQKRAFIDALDRGDREEAYRIYKEAITELEDLPDPILAKILFLTSVRDLHYLKRVSKRFRNVINEYELIRRRENSNGQLYAFGNGMYGKLGDGETVYHDVGRPIFININGQSVKQVSAGSKHTMVVTENGQLYGFGNGMYGKLGDGRIDDHSVGRPIFININGQSVKQVSAGDEHTMVVTENGQLYGFGWGIYGALGNGRTDNHSVGIPTLVNMGDQLVKQVSAGRDYTMVVTGNGQLYAFGNGEFGKLGDGRIDSHSVGMPISININGQSVKQVSAGSRHTIVVTENGQLYGFGNGRYGVLGDGRTDDHFVGTPIFININRQSVKQVSVGSLHTMILTENGQLYAFGNAEAGVLGNGRTDEHSVGVPALVDMGGQLVKQVSAGDEHTMVVTENGQLYGFGWGIYGALGNGRTDNHSVGIPTLVNMGDQLIKQVSVGSSYTMVVTEPIFYNDLSVYTQQIATQISDCEHCRTKLTDQQCKECNMILCGECFDRLHL